MSDQPKPTGEWTVKTVLELWQMGGAGCDTNSRMIDIANAHNAALAAEEKRCIEANAEQLETLRQLREHDRQQLAAERRTTEQQAEIIVGLHQQLAAEREKWKP